MSCILRNLATSGFSRGIIWYSSRNVTICIIHSSIEFSIVLQTISGLSGASYGWSMPVNPLISPALAFLYKPKD